jgi:type II secretory pathway pseudopilin PulG
MAGQSRPRERKADRAATIRRTFALLALLAVSAFLWACGRAGEQAAQDVVHAIDQGKVIGTRGTMENIGKALTAYAMDRGGYPQGNSIQDATASLVPSFLPSAVTVDAWGNTFDYRSDARSFTLTSPGADGRTGSADDLVMTDARFTQLPGPAAP